MAVKMKGAAWQDAAKFSDLLETLFVLSVLDITDSIRNGSMYHLDLADVEFLREFEQIPIDDR